MSLPPTFGSAEFQQAALVILAVLGFALFNLGRWAQRRLDDAEWRHERTQGYHARHRVH